MAHFTKDYVQFLKDLAANNNRDWFHANKKRYEQSVKDPFTNFVGDLIKEVQKKDKSVQIEPKDAMFRIYRDVRFSKDKTPYKTNMSAVISSGGRKDMVRPGMYIQLGPEDVRIYGGLYMLDKNQLQMVRESIAGDLKKFDRLINDKQFKKYYGEVLGEKNKRIPKEFKEVEEKQPLIANKSFYYFAKLSPKVITDPKLIKTIMDHYKVGQPMSQYLAKAAGV